MSAPAKACEKNGKGWDEYIREWESKPLVCPTLKYEQNGHDQHVGPVLPPILTCSNNFQIFLYVDNFTL